jgi:hypothetical protein
VSFLGNLVSGFGQAIEGIPKDIKDVPHDVAMDIGLTTPADESETPPSDSGMNKRFTAVTDPTGAIKDYTAEDGGSKFDWDDPANLPAPQELSDEEYDTLTKQASQGNDFAKQILERGDYKAHDYPSAIQDLQSVTNPFVAALSNMPTMATSLASQQQAAMSPYDFSNAESSVNELLSMSGIQGVTPMAAPNAETQSYVNTLTGIANSYNPLTSPGPDGVPSTMQALESLGPLAKQSQQASPYAQLLNALLSHGQYETIYGGEPPPATAEDPAWLQQLIASVTGSTATGGLVSPTIAAGGVGAGTIPAVSTAGGGNA